jgi:hypothetical protein
MTTTSETGTPGEFREALGRLVREVWVKWAGEQPNPKPSWLTGWEGLDEGQREVDMRIGEAVAARYENAITWNTSCLGCATLLDSCYDETCRREQAEAKLAAVRDLVRQLGDRSNEPALPAPEVKVHLPLSDRRIVEPLRRMLLEILDGKP